MLIRRRTEGAGAGRTPEQFVGARPERAVTLRIDDREIEALPGHTIAAALWRAGILSWRRTRAGAEPRGVFCGIGVCFDCLVVVNGQRDVRACQRRARDGDTVEIQHDELPRPVAAAPRQAARDDAGRRDPGAADD
jgi:hypothetical protein